jgi:NADH:ubiquinone oxidoreductase subunit 6 (subunit J)
MIVLILGSFFCLLIFMMMAANPGNKLIQNKNTKSHLLDLLIAYVGGFLFVVTVRLFESGAPERSFDLFYDVLDGRSWRIGRDNFEDFFFAFIITYIIVFIRSQCKKI